MAITLKVKEKDFRIGVWDVTEPEAYFLENFNYASEELAEIRDRHTSHRLQLLASRAVLYDMELTNSGYKIIKDDHGKPHVINVQGDISFSHSHDFAAAIYSKSRLVGIDIQIGTSKINRIAKKFISQKEFEYININPNTQDYHHVLWGAKESLYKAYGRRKVEFRDNLYVQSFVYNPIGGKIKGTVSMPDYVGHFDIYYQKIAAYYLVYCIEKTSS